MAFYKINIVITTNDSILDSREEAFNVFRGLQELDDEELGEILVQQAPHKYLYVYADGRLEESEQDPTNKQWQEAMNNELTVICFNYIKNNFEVLQPRIDPRAN